MMPSTSNTEPVADVTVNLEGMWMLQAMLDIATVAPELHTVPYGAPRNNEWLAADPRVEVLQQAGVVGADRQVAPAVAHRMQILGAPDVEVAMLIASGPLTWPGRIDVNDASTWRRDVPDNQLQVVLARRDGRWVSAVRAGADITIDDIAFEGACAPWLRDIIVGQLDALHPIGPSRLQAMNFPFDDVVAAAAARADGAGSGRDLSLRTLGVPASAAAELGQLLDEPVTEAVMYARAYVDARQVRGTSALNLRDSQAGRVALYRMPARRGSIQDWMAIAPATPRQVLQGVQAMLSSVAVTDWDSHRRLR